MSIKLPFPGWPCPFARDCHGSSTRLVVTSVCMTEVDACMRAKGLPFQFSPFPRWKTDPARTYRVVWHGEGLGWRLTDHGIWRWWTTHFAPNAESPYGAWRFRR